jgi:hypothetical protein
MVSSLSSYQRRCSLLVKDYLLIQNIQYGEIESKEGNGGKGQDR